MKYVPFNIEDAKRGIYVVNRLGMPVRIIYYDYNGGDSLIDFCTNKEIIAKYPIIALVKTGDGIESIVKYTIEGKSEFVHMPGMDLVHPELMMHFDIFDINAAKNGCKVVTRGGVDARIICYDRNDVPFHGKSKPIVALIKYPGGEHISLHYENGRKFCDGSVDTEDLLLAE